MNTDRVWGIVPAAGIGSRLQPLAFSKELLPVGSRFDGGVERPRAVCEHLIDRMALGGANRLLFVISAAKSDIVQYFGGEAAGLPIGYLVQPRASGLCDSVFRAAPFVEPDDAVIIGLPDTIWFPEDALAALPRERLAFLLFPVARPELFDAVVMDADGAVEAIDVKRADVRSSWIWGAIRMPGEVFHDLRALWIARDRRDEYLGTLVNAWLAGGGSAVAVRAGESYVDVGTLHGYREAIELLQARGRRSPAGTLTGALTPVRAR